MRMERLGGIHSAPLNLHKLQTVVCFIFSHANQFSMFEFHLVHATATNATTIIIIDTYDFPFIVIMNSVHV